MSWRETSFGSHIREAIAAFRKGNSRLSGKETPKAIGERFGSVEEMMEKRNTSPDVRSLFKELKNEQD